MSDALAGKIGLFCFQRKNGFVERKLKKKMPATYITMISLCFNERTLTSFFDRICTTRGRL